MSVLRTYNQDKVEGVEMSEHCKWCNFPCEDEEIFCKECLNANPKLARLNEFFLEQEKRINELDDMVDAYQKSEALDIAKMDKKDERIKDLELALSNSREHEKALRKCFDNHRQRIKELEEQCTKYQAELMNNDPALNYMSPTTEESSPIEKEN